MESNCQKNLPRPKSHLPKNHLGQNLRQNLGQNLIILLSSFSLLGTGLIVPLQGARAEATIPLENNLGSLENDLGDSFVETPLATPVAPVAPEQLAAPVLTVPQANIDSEEIIRGMQPSEETAAESPIPSPVDNFADINDYGLTGRSGSLNNPDQNIAPPETIVLNERSTGCANVLVNGAVPDQICPTTQLATKPLEVPAPPVMNFPGDLQPVSVLGMEVAPSGFRLASNSSDAGSKTASGSFFSRNRPVGRPGTGRGTFMFPLTIPAVITSIFGWRVHPIFGATTFHSGTDLGADQGTPVIAVTDGKVAAADFMGGYGLTVVLRHEEDKYESLYAHLSQIMVQPGEEVRQGTVIGLVGSTGNSTGPHLHFEWRTATNDGWVTADPTEHLQFALDQFMLALAEPESKPLFSGLPKVEVESPR